jgi:hypothetical protein
VELVEQTSEGERVMKVARWLRALTVGVTGMIGLSPTSKLLGIKELPVEKKLERTTPCNEERATDILLERLDVDRFQEEHGMLVATNHVR